MEDQISLMTLALAKKYTDDHGGGGGTSDYDELNHLPQMNGTELKGNMLVGLSVSSGIVSFYQEVEA